MQDEFGRRGPRVTTAPRAPARKVTFPTQPVALRRRRAPARVVVPWVPMRVLRVEDVCDCARCRAACADASDEPARTPPHDAPESP